MNAKEEFLRVTDKSILKCAVISKETNIWYDEADEKPEDIILPIGFTEEEYNEFLSKLDFTYNNGFGGQQLFGIIWNNNDTWIDRGEYDGSEWWQKHSYPELDEQVKR